MGGGVCVSEEECRAGRVILTITPHPHGEALLQAAVLAPVPVVLGDLAVLVAAALVAQLCSCRSRCMWNRNCGTGASPGVFIRCVGVMRLTSSYISMD